MQKFLSSVFPLGTIMLVLTLALQACGSSRNVQPNRGSIKVDAVYATDWQQRDETTFARGDAIYYNVEVNNTMGSQSSLTIHFQVVAINYSPLVASHLYAYDSTTHINTVYQGLADFQTPTSIPSNVAPATYKIHITVTPGNTAFSSDSGQNGFTIQPPSQLGPFKTGTFTRDNGNVQGSAQITLFQNGGYKFSGCMQNISSFTGYGDVFSWVFVSASGTAYEFNHTGSISGEVQFWQAEHQDCWSVKGTNKAIATDWLALTFQKTNHWDGSVNSLLDAWVQGVVNFIKEEAPHIIEDIIDVVGEAVADAG